MIPVLETSRIRMRGHRIDDFPAIAQMWADEAVTRHISGTPSSKSESWSRLLRYIGHWTALDFGYWLVEDIQTGSFLGEVGFASYKRQMNPPLPELPEIGWVLTPKAQGKGIATEAVHTALHWADAHLAADKTVCIIGPDHRASIRVADKSGYLKQGMADFAGAQTLVMERSKQPQNTL